ncbi:hypothetical protein [Saccharothrix sp.]|uniref:hypothetical protein n=1 Tax=Saccharothrix sp. TaxID=1873460 RepID=UPI002810FAFE|nr:hypothetical protein [Saccharothrix sp.]
MNWLAWAGSSRWSTAAAGAVSKAGCAAACGVVSRPATSADTTNVLNTAAPEVAGSGSDQRGHRHRDVDYRSEYWTFVHICTPVREHEKGAATEVTAP